MATGETYRSLRFQFRISHSWISKIIKQTLKAICKNMMHVAIPPITEEHLSRVSEDFKTLWSFPNCCGAIDGKHIRIKSPSNSGSLYYNYKEYFSIVLLALVDANYKFLAVDIGAYGNEGDAGIFAKSNFGKKLANGRFPLPAPKALPGCSTALPHIIVGDEAFQLSSYMMRPYPREQAHQNEEKAVFNLRLSRARRTSEIAFGILCQYFRVFFTVIGISPDVIDNLVAAACIIHNLLRDGKVPYPKEDTSKDDYAFDMPKANIRPLKKHAYNANNDAYRLRDEFKNYFSSPESMLHWQLNQVRRKTR